MKKIIYISGKIEPRGNDKGTYKEYVQIGKDAAVKLWNMGYGVLCPHGNTDIDHSKITVTYDDFIEADLIMLDGCDCIFMLRNWKSSKGAKIEHAFAIKNNIPILYTMKEAGEFVKKNRGRCYITNKIRTGKYKKIENCMISPGMTEKIQSIVDSRVYRMYKEFSLTPKLNSNNTGKKDKKQAIRR